MSLPPVNLLLYFPVLWWQSHSYLFCFSFTFIQFYLAVAFHDSYIIWLDFICFFWPFNNFCCGWVCSCLFSPPHFFVLQSRYSDQLLASRFCVSTFAKGAANTDIHLLDFSVYLFFSVLFKYILISYFFSPKLWECHLSQGTKTLGRATGLSAEVAASRNPGLSANKNEKKKNSACFSCLPGRHVYISDIPSNIGKNEPPVWIIAFGSHVSGRVLVCSLEAVLTGLVKISRGDFRGWHWVWLINFSKVCGCFQKLSYAMLFDKFS